MPGFTYDRSTPIGRVRLLMPDNRAGKMRFDDGEIGDFLDEEGGVAKAAAALGLEVLATNKADAIGYVKTYAMEVDGTKVCDALLKRAAKLRDQVAALAVTVDENEETWDFSFDGEPYL